MKIFALSFFVLTLSWSMCAQAQNLSLEQLISVYSKDEEQVDIYLTRKGWERAQSSDPNHIATWAYNRRIQSLPIISDISPSSQKPKVQYEAQSWLSLKTKDETTTLVYSIPNLAQFSLIRQRILSLGMKKVLYGSDNNATNVVYQGANYEVQLTTRLNEGGLTESNQYLLYLNSR